MMRSKLLAATALAAGLILGALGAGALRADAQSNTVSKNMDTYEQLDLFGEVFERVRSGYVEEVKDQDLIESAINGMLTSLDPHSSYLNAQDYQDMQVQTKGEFGGLGIEVTMQDGLIKVVTPMDDSPAAKAGIQSGDLISFLDGEPVFGLTLNQAVEKMRGAVGSSILLTIIRGDKDPFDVSLKREIITIKSVRWELEENGVGYVRINSFSEKTDNDLKDALNKLKQAAGGNLSGLVLDLRNNPGGLLDQAISVSDDFLERGEIVSTRGRNAEEMQRWNATAGDFVNGKPVVVLINGGSASASEIVAGALQDHRRAILMGTKSFGKGSVQSIIPIPGHGAIRLTTARYYTPSGRSIQAKGIDPDIEVGQAKVETLDEGKGRHEADLRGALENKGGTAPEDAGTSKGATPGKTQKPDAKNGAQGNNAVKTLASSEKERFTNPAADYQLARALDLLQGLDIFQNQQKKAN